MNKLKCVESWQVLLLLAVGSWARTLCADGDASEVKDNEVDYFDFSESNRQFSAAVYQNLAKTNRGNFITCPLSVQTVMALASAGAKGETSKQIARGLNLPTCPNHIRDIFEQVTPSLRGNEFYTLSSANKIYVDERFKLNKEYQKVARDSFDAEVDSVDFAENDKAAEKINDWVYERTNGKIRHLLTSEGLNEQTKLVLVNTLYFKGKWVYPFEEDNTVEKPFYVSPTESKQVSMMQHADFYDYYEHEGLDAKFLKIPFMLNEVSMVFVLPNKIDGLSKLESNMEEVLKEHKYTNQQVRVQIPKFSMESTTQYVPILKDLGIENVFTQGADLSGISANGNQLSINSVIQKTFINVTETGTEAAAATAVNILERIGEEEVFSAVPFIAEHPFMFVLVHHPVDGIIDSSDLRDSKEESTTEAKATTTTISSITNYRSIVFVGRFCKPIAKEM